MSKFMDRCKVTDFSRLADDIKESGMWCTACKCVLVHHEKGNGDFFRFIGHTNEYVPELRKTLLANGDYKSVTLAICKDCQ